MANKFLDSTGLSYLWSKISSKFLSKAEGDSKYLKLSGGTLTGNLTGRYLTGTWLQTTAVTNKNSAADKIAVIDSSGWIYYRTAEEILNDIGAASAASGADPYKVGDILYTARTDLGDKWLLCNGDEIDKNAYPELSEIITLPISKMSKMFEYDIIDTQGNEALTGIKKLNDYYFVWGYKGQAPGASGPFFWSKDLVTWHEVTFSGASMDRYYDIEYIDGYYVIVGCGGGSMQYQWYYPRIYRSTNPESTFTYVSNRLPLSGGGSVPPGAITGIGYFNGTYVISGAFHDDDQTYLSNLKAKVYTATSLTGTWTQRYSDTSTYTSMGKIKYLNGRYVATQGIDDNLNGSTGNVPVIYYSSSFTSGWTKKTLSIPSDVTHDYRTNARDIIYAKGNYLVIGSSDQGIELWYSSSITGSFSRKRIMEEASNILVKSMFIYYDEDTDLLITAPFYYEGSIPTRVYAPLYYAKNITDTWTKIDLVNEDDGLYSLSALVKDDSNFVFSGGGVNSGTYVQSTVFISPKLNALPSISVDKAYAYIRAKE